MARGTTLVRLLDLYRVECRLSNNPAHNSGTRDAQVAHIQRVQEWFWNDFDWPLLRVDRFIELQAGQRYYQPPEDLDIDRIQRVEVRHDDVYNELRPGIDAEHYSAYDSDLDERQWPPQRWKITEDQQIEVWPIPDSDFNSVTLEGRMKLTGIRKLRPLVADDDRADLDDVMIISRCAAEYLAGTGAKDANMKMQTANARYARLRGQQMPRKRFTMFGAGRPERVRRIPIAVYNKTS